MGNTSSNGSTRRRGQPRQPKQHRQSRPLGQQGNFSEPGRPLSQQNQNSVVNKFPPNSNLPNPQSTISSTDKQGSTPNFHPFPQSFLIDQPNFNGNHNLLAEGQRPISNITQTEPPPYELTCNQVPVQQAIVPLSEQNKNVVMNGTNIRNTRIPSVPSAPRAPSLNLMSTNAPMTTDIIVTNSKQANSRRISRHSKHYDDDYSDDPSDYESDDNRRKMHQGYYSEYDYYDKDNDYIYYKTQDGHRFKCYRW